MVWWFIGIYAKEIMSWGSQSYIYEIIRWDVLIKLISTAVMRYLKRNTTWRSMSKNLNLTLSWSLHKLLWKGGLRVVCSWSVPGGGSKVDLAAICANHYCVVLLSIMSSWLSIAMLSTWTRSPQRDPKVHAMTYPQGLIMPLIDDRM